MSSGVNCQAIATKEECLATVGCRVYIVENQVVCKCSKFAYGTDDNCHQCNTNEIANKASTACICYDGNGIKGSSNVCEKCTGNTYADIQYTQDQAQKQPCSVCNAIGRKAIHFFADDMAGNNNCRCDEAAGFKDNLSQNVNCECQDGLVLSSDNQRCVPPGQQNSGNNSTNSGGSGEDSGDNSGSGGSNGEASGGSSVGMAVAIIAILIGIAVAVALVAARRNRKGKCLVVQNDQERESDVI